MTRVRITPVGTCGFSVRFAGMPASAIVFVTDGRIRTGSLTWTPAGGRTDATSQPITRYPELMRDIQREIDDRERFMRLRSDAGHRPVRRSPGPRICDLSAPGDDGPVTA